MKAYFTFLLVFAYVDILAGDSLTPSDFKNLTCVSLQAAEYKLRTVEELTATPAHAPFEAVGGVFLRFSHFKQNKNVYVRRNERGGALKGTPLISVGLETPILVCAKLSELNALGISSSILGIIATDTEFEKPFYLINSNSYLRVTFNSSGGIYEVSCPTCKSAFTVERGENCGNCTTCINMPSHLDPAEARSSARSENADGAGPQPPGQVWWQRRGRGHTD